MRKNDYCQRDNLAEKLNAFHILKGKSADPYSYEEYQAIINVYHDFQHRKLATLAVYTEFRTRELRALCRDALDISNRLVHTKCHTGKLSPTLKLAKAGQARHVDLKPPAITALYDQWQFTAHLNPIEMITMHHGEPLEKQPVVSAFKPEGIIRHKTGLDIYAGSSIGSPLEIATSPSECETSSFLPMQTYVCQLDTNQPWKPSLHCKADQSLCPREAPVCLWKMD
ncbi:hypothetical protein QCD60_22025 [Pokkaliibacter sp. MBI-7]|uniref:hypothetical protein n=1 Tax=Pokkaliibacter sp. MBI-7 TaxID=3040600 RepID=UPI00244B51BA|nr:hypothetical protein [Pokkaliibacter sp. MBI-7]MDH2435207.1 hypothetical protein [Pokkaliibacter sp. MBI-7]